MGNSPRVVFQHYREIVTAGTAEDYLRAVDRQTAKQFWQILPPKGPKKGRAKKAV